ncbi:cysteine proteinase [Heliocybe sulcata]|uniref:Cysteine proteinase n=1 Tax=Heliocybe sulcata TaxID=5364 RepID=A0A5C3NKL5_9AGAM|nr:cysteine proteinase [Heliocybe sulcata]
MVEKQKQREQMMKELYTMRRAAGYGSNFHTFQDYMNYRAHLELLERREALPPSPSLADLRSKSPAQRKERRYSTSDYVETDLLTRSLEKARETLNSPRPPKPFIPSFDQLRISARNKDEAIERTLRPKRPPLPASLPPEDEAQVADFLANPKFLARLKREKVAAPDLERLTPGLWLNDEIINFYGALMMSRWETEKENRANQPQGNPTGRAGSRLLNIHYFNSFFWPKLLKEGYTTSLARWTNKVDIFAKDAVILAVNHGNSHWTAAAINFRRKRIESYDSMGFVRDTVYKVLRDYLDGEHRDKKKKPFDFTGWENYTLEATPQQENGYDCGVFTCQFMEYLSRGEQEFNFTQEDMPYLRSRMIWEIGNVRLRDD